MNRPAEIITNYLGATDTKVNRPLWRTFLLAILAGMLIAFGALASTVASYSITLPSVAKTVSGLLFPFGLAMVILTGAELFTGNNLMTLGLMARTQKFGGVLISWLVTYLGNLVGSVLVALGAVVYGPLNPKTAATPLLMNAVSTATNKVSMGFGKALVLGILCNVLVCLGVLCANASKSAPGRIMGGYMPVAFFVIAGFEHSIANMYYIPAGSFIARAMDPALLAEAGLSADIFNLGAFFGKNLLPVTLGNIIGGTFVAALMWYGHHMKRPE